jgi:DNA-binding NarL/FixJ family response regulator
MDSIADTSPRRLARIAGALYLINIVLGAFAIGVIPAIIAVGPDAAATVHNIQTHELLYRLGLTAHVVVLSLYDDARPRARAQGAGAPAFVAKHKVEETLLAAIRRAASRRPEYG